MFYMYSTFITLHLKSGYNWIYKIELVSQCIWRDKIKNIKKKCKIYHI